MEETNSLDPMEPVAITLKADGGKARRARFTANVLRRAQRALKALGASAVGLDSMLYTLYEALLDREGIENAEALGEMIHASEVGALNDVVALAIKGSLPEPDPTAPASGTLAS